ncbi:MAG: glycerol kinase GlpK [Burkholderiaceae bacterium]|nr:glycerol kinase GlpK [Burkholderiaceae bacterium]
MSYLIALDQGTTSSRAVVFNRDGSIKALAQQEFAQLYPQPGWVEHDPMAIWHTQRDVLARVLKTAGVGAHEVAGIGITNQRETTLVWNKHTGQPIHHAIVWQDRRTTAICDGLRDAGLLDEVRSKTGLLLDPYFSGTKIRWMLDHVPGAQALAQQGDLLFGTVDTWLVWQLTGRKRHVTDVSNAARTMLFNIHTGQWDDALLSALDIPRCMLPEVLPSSADFGHTDASVVGHSWPIGGVAGDQQSAMFGQTCFVAGQAKNTYGTGCFMLMHTGTQGLSSRNGLLTTRLAQWGTQPTYALEGSVFMGGAVVQWLRDGLGAINSSADVQALAASVATTAGVVMVPAFTGLGAPYWLPDAQGSITGLSRGTTMAHIARAALESIALQSTALLQAMSKDAQSHGGQSMTELRVDGGACVNDLLMQMQADLAGVAVVRPQVVETTALGAAYLAGLQVGLYQDLAQLQAQWRVQRVFEPQWSREQALEKMNQWERAVAALPKA